MTILEAIVGISLVIHALTLLILVFFLLQLIRQQGRILLRLEDLERAVAGESGKSAAAASVRTGLNVGTLVDDFEVPDLDGREVSLSDFRGSRVLLVYWSADCEFCDLIAPDLVRVESRLGETKTKLLLLAYGSADANRKLVREHGLTSPVLLVEGSSALKQLEIRVFHYCGTPSAYLLDEHGRVTQPLANGAEEVVALVEEAATGKAAKGRFRKLPLTASGIEREGLEPGSPAPAFSLPDIHGQLISLEQFRGGQVLLVFSDPQCVPCNDLAPRLVEFDRQHGDKPLAVVMVGRGHQEQNQRTVEEHGIRFPVVLQQRWRLSKEYGIFATPVAFLIGPDGVIARDVAKGSDAIMQLAREGLASEEALEEEKEASVWDNYSTTSPAS